MKNWNLRTLVFLRALSMVVVPLWFFIYKSTIPTAFFWIFVLGVTLWIQGKLEKEIKTQTDECAQALLDKLTRNMENITYVLAVGMIIFLVNLPSAEDPGFMGLVAAQILAWGIFGIHLYRGITFWIRDKIGWN